MTVLPSRFIPQPNRLRQVVTLTLVLASLLVAQPLFANDNTVRTLRWAHVYEPSHPLHQAAIWASNEINIQTKGRFKIEVYPSSSLGKEAHINQSLSLGSVDIIYTGTSFAAQTHKPLGLSEMPYIFANFEHWQRFVNSRLFDDMAQVYRTKSGGNVILSSNYYGERHLTANQAVLSPKDIQGLKIRVPGSAMYQLFPLALGAKPSPIAFSEVYLAIQQGVVDAQENPLPTIKAKKFYEVQGHINLTGHILGSILAIASHRMWDQLSANERSIFTRVLRHAAESASKQTRQQEAQLVSWFKQNGIAVNTVNRDAFRQTVLNHYKHTHFTFDRDGYERIQNL